MDMESMLNKFMQGQAAMARVMAYRAEMDVAIAKGEYPPDYSGDIHREAELIESIWRG